MYAAALSENKMRKAGGAKLRKYFYRRMRYMMKEYTELKNSGEHAEGIDTQPLKEFNCEEPERCVRPIGSLDRHEIYEDPTKGSVCLKLMRALTKFSRMLYVSVIYYFMPFVFIFITFVTGIRGIN